MLIAAGVVALLAILVIGVVLFSGGGNTRPTDSPSQTTSPSGSGPTGSATPRPTRSPTGSGEPTATPSVAPGDIEEVAAEICAAPVPPYDALQPQLLSAFGAYCEEAVTAVLTDDSIDLTAIQAAGWAFTAGGGDVEGAVTVSRVFLDLTGERQVRRYAVSHDSAGGATIDGDPIQVRRINDPLLIFRWSAG